MNAEVKLLDTTLRDGEQMPGLAFAPAEKVAWAKKIAAIGIRDIEAITPAMGKHEIEAARRLMDAKINARIYSWNRLREHDVNASLELGIQHLFISAPVSYRQMSRLLKMTRSGLMDQFTKLVSFAVSGVSGFSGDKTGVSQKTQVTCGLMDFKFADREFLTDLAIALKEAGATRLRLSDTTGSMTPSEVFESVTFLRKASEADKKDPLPVEFHGHNDFGLATANALSAYEAGALWIDTTLLGIGERAGNVKLEEAVMAFSCLKQAETGVDPQKMAALSRRFSKRCNVPITQRRPVLGEKIFEHESGIHADGVTRDASFFEPYQPELTGKKRRIVPGKHSGTRALAAYCRSLKIQPDSVDIAKALEMIRDKAVRLKRSLDDSEARFILQAAQKARS